jgi:hypothetical protein
VATSSSAPLGQVNILKRQPFEGVHTLNRMIVECHTLDTVHSNTLNLLLAPPKLISNTHSRTPEIVGNAKEALACHGQTIVHVRMCRGIELGMNLYTEHIHRGNSSEAQDLRCGNYEILLR